MKAIWLKLDQNLIIINYKNIEAFIVSKSLKNKHNGSIIDGLLFQMKEKDGEEEKEKDVIVTIGSDNKIIILK